MNRCFFLTLLLISFISVSAQNILTPSEFLGYKLGDQFTPHYRVVDYFKYIASQSPNVKLNDYGKTYEGRDLLTATIASEENIKRLEDIRINNLKLTGIEKGEGNLDAPAIVWLSFNVHGNEASSTEVSMQALFSLVDKENKQSQDWLKKVVVIIDPCLNPDGRDRYVNFYNSVRGKSPDPLSSTREHIEPWPGGRTNHYYFDLNRDWAWQTQVETQQRMQLYNQWLPQIHVDFHEQGFNEPYYFAPAAEPYHETITKWQRDFQKIIGKNNARYFDAHSWMYFTRERFDLLYPSYGDTYPIYNGSIGMTYEQGGSHRAGLAVINNAGDTLTLKDRIDHHFTAALSTIEVASEYRGQLLAEFRNFYTSSRKNPPGEFKTYVVKNEEKKALKSLELLLTRNGIFYEYGIEASSRGFNYSSGLIEKFEVGKYDMVIRAFQPKSVLLKVLFEPKTNIADSNTYDITAWSIPYAFGLKTYGVKGLLNATGATKSSSRLKAAEEVPNAIAYLAEWNSMTSVKFLAKLLSLNIRVRFSEVPMETGGTLFSPGSLIISRANNQSIGNNFDLLIKQIAAGSGVNLKGISSGLVDKGADLGSGKIRPIKKPRVAVLSGKDVSSLSLGEIWHFFEQELDYPLSIIRAEDVDRLYVAAYDILIFPEGNYPHINTEKLQSWVNGGGKLIAVGGAVDHLVNKKVFSIRNKDTTTREDDKKRNIYQHLRPFENRERESLQSNIPGAIYKVSLDNTHPLGYGFPDYYFTLKTSDQLYQFLDKGWNVGVLKSNSYLSGVVGSKVKEKLRDGLLFGVEEYGNGSVIYLVDNPLFRGFWETGKMLFSNAVFMVGQ